ncbi:MAG: hypothetical protein JXA06_08640 [Bacteroidetes bacterium]|nr:hypothetical protein [Bacteroidota bacterium]
MKILFPRCSRLFYCFLIIGAFLLQSFTSFLLAYAQDVSSNRQLTAEQLLQNRRSIKNHLHNLGTPDKPVSYKCGFAISAALHNQWNNFSSLQKKEINALIAVPEFQKSRAIGKFRFLYDTTGLNEPALLDGNYNRIPGTYEEYIDSLGRIFNEVYHVEVELLNYEAPPFEQGESHYRVFVTDMSSYPGAYGCTDWDYNLPPLNSDGAAPRYPCFIELHKDFSEYQTKGMDAVRVTAAHEFHHVVQIGSYGFRDGEIPIHEITSTWMEDVVYPEVNDYLNYLKDYFEYFSNGLSFNYCDFSHLGYERCIWAHFLEKRFDRDIIREMWNEMRTLTFLSSADAVLSNRGSDLRTEFSEFTRWNYYTADRADLINYYPEGDRYPRFQPLKQCKFISISGTAGGDVFALSSSYYEFIFAADTVTAMVSNVDVNAAIQKNGMTRRVDVVCSSNIPSLPYQEFDNGLTAKIFVEDTSLWRSVYSEGILRDSIPGPVRFAVSLNAAPNPFRLADSKQLRLPIQDNTASTATVYFYSSSLSLVFSKSLPVSIAGANRIIEVQSSDLVSYLSSGIYFVVAKTKKNEFRWKVAVIR